ncbi:helix-turn-helix transcriptional regulator [Amycolatopsis bartoniae]|uniref:Helix-turn-helix transcriptional regulator n=1 Tax=Amycolatopsis bartoniae TaxID=941986 RepID=A0A8H9J1H6_9PSEU|nr:helix-turn-helix transcriptional regulator [Amycolatopsis bartoniae]
MSGTGLHGRDSALAALSGLLARARGKTGGTLEVRGEPGLGRTALLDAAARAADDFRVLRLRGSAGEKALPGAGLLQLSEALGTACDSADTDFARYQNFTRALAEAARERPVLCCVDDVDQLDPLSWQGISFCARRADGHAIAFLLAGGPPSTGDFPVVPLHPLGAEASRRLLDDLVPDGLPPDLAEELVALASGNPLALTELADALTPGQLAGTAPPPVALPAESRLRQRFRCRYDRLSPAAQGLVRLVVAAGRVRSGILADELRALDEVTGSRLVHEDGDVIAVAGQLTRSCLIAEMSWADRYAAHEKLAKLLDDGQHPLEVLAHRAAIAPRPDTTLADELAEAASRARQASDYEAASGAYRQAADLTAEPRDRALRLLSAARDSWLAGQAQHSRVLLRRLRPLTCDRTIRGLAALLAGEIELRDGAPAAGHRSLLEAADDLGSADPSLAVTALMRAGEATFAAGNLHGFFTTAERAHALLRPSEPLLHLMTDHFSGLEAVLRGEHERAREPLRRVVTAAANVPGCAPKAWAALAALVLGDDQRAQELAAQAVAAATGDGSGVLAPWALDFLAHAALRLDHYASAASAAVDGLRLAQAAGQHNCVVHHLAMLALLAARLGDRETALLRLANVTEDARDLAGPKALNAWARACLELTEDRPADALERLRAVAPNPFVRIMATPQVVEAAVRCGERAAATEALERFDEWACSTGSPAQLALSQRCQALLAAGEEADEHFREALRLHRRADRPFELARTELFYGERLRRHRKPRNARKYLRSAWQTFQRYEATYWADRARAELRAAGEAVELPAPAGLDLTPQQAQISKLVAAGATNREIAAQLFLSPRTVEHHLRNIFAKLGIRSRVELTTLFR